MCQDMLVLVPAHAKYQPHIKAAASQVGWCQPALQ
jgi:hypothetical protein